MARTGKTKNNQPILENFAKKMAAKRQDTKYVISPQGEISMSDAVSQLIAPYADEDLSYESFHTLVTIACAAWNATLLPAAERDALLEKMLAALSPQQENRPEMLGFIKKLMERKKQLFPHISRIILEFKVTDIGDDFHIAIASTLEK